MKTIVVPKDKIAEQALDYDNATSEQLLEVFLDEFEFRSLRESGFFESINEIANSNIDNYEDEKIVESEKIMSIVNSKLFVGSSYEEDVQLKIVAIRELFEEASRRGTGVYFYF